ncbi:MAG: sulfurtransferase complex subunit TusC [gamma proteobacterium symbiont of Lucinoma myriamae]|nr:sulfurtransferase complex subunit TusC [gamma proteobacterium symbiont of Lucinoma myriamae]MCU7819485.1 sulfurtransferase complex subunit TusC [gamma proteobacterium symbiont of Lucinoma myriamae]MCU7831413.1 sulfurtransferase complex subunit TusC [gamma proteobacterium symbiont of Lucinoma myriamae]
MSESIKKFMFVNTKAPYGTVYALESLEVVLISAAFDQDVSLVFCDDGVFQISNNQNTEASGMKNFSNAYKALGDYDINKLYVEKESLEERGLTLDNIMDLTYEDEDWAEKPSIKLVTRAELADLMDEQDVVISS